MNLLDKNGILDLTNYNKDFNWKEHEDIIKNIKGFNIKGYKYNIDFKECNLFNDNGINFLDLSEYKGCKINFEKSNIKFNKISVKNSLGEIYFLNIEKNNKLKYLDLSDFKGENIYFESYNISFKKISVKNSLGKINFCCC
jgi:hypothetical protein